MYANERSLKPFIEGAQGESRVPLLSMSDTATLTDNSSHMASNDQLRFGKMIGDALGGLDPVLGALLSPTGGIPGPGNNGVGGVAYVMGGGKDVVITHGIAHDAAGYLFTYHNMGPGYQYVPGRSGILPVSNPLAGQMSGIDLYYNLKNYGSVVRPIDVWN